MKRTIVFAACLLAMSASHATHCANGLPDTYYPACIPPATSQPSTLSQQQQQQQAAIAGAAASSNSGATATGLGGTGGAANASGAGANAGAGAGAAAGQYAGQGAGAGAGASAGAGAGAGAGSNNPTTQTTTVNTGGAAGSGDRYLSVALPPAPPALAPTMVGGAVSVTALPCGPAQRVVAEAVYGTQFGIFSDRQVFLGGTETTAPYLDESGQVAPYIRIGGRWYGHQVVYTAGMPGVSGASSIGIGGFGGSGGGNVGGGVSAGMQRIVTTVQLRLCELGPVAPPIATVAVPSPVSALPLLTKPIAR